MPYPANNCSTFKTQFLPCYWALVEAEYLTAEHQVTMQPELPFMNEYLAIMVGMRNSNLL